MLAIEQTWSLEDLPTANINKSKKYITGTTWRTNEGDLVTIVGQSLDMRTRWINGRKYNEYYKSVIQFPEGHYTTVLNNSLRLGKVKNHMRRNLLKVGRIGVGKNKTHINKIATKEFILWSHLIERLHNKSHLKRRPNYKECTVAPRWTDYQYFCEDLPSLCGYPEWCLDPSRYELDKDGLVYRNKHYSKETCMLLPRELNTMLANFKGKGYTQTKYGGYATYTSGEHLGIYKSEYIARQVHLDAKRKYTLNQVKDAENTSEEIKEILYNYIETWYKEQWEENERTNDGTSNSKN